MAIILGVEALPGALYALTGASLFAQLAAQMHHTPWHGFSAYDLVFPLFLFVAGVSLGLRPLSLSGRPWDQRREHYARALRRLGLLLVLGVIYNHGWGTGMPAEPESVRYASVLGRIGIAGFAASLLAWHCRLSTQLWVALGVLVGYWGLQTLVPVPGFGAGVLSPDGSINAWVDQRWLPGATYQNRAYDPEGLLSQLPAVLNALAGVWAGRWLRYCQRMPRRLSVLVLAGVLALILGWLWHRVYPVNKELWTGSFVLVTVGWSALALALFHGLIEGLGWRRWALPFVVVGMNALPIYLASSLVDWRFTANSLVGGWSRVLPETGHELVVVCALLAVQWLILAFLYRRRVFIRI